MAQIRPTTHTLTIAQGLHNPVASLTGHVLDDENGQTRETIKGLGYARSGSSERRQGKVKEWAGMLPRPITSMVPASLATVQRATTDHHRSAGPA